MTLRSRLKQTLQTQRNSGNAVTRYGVGVIYAALEQRLNVPGQSVIVSICALVLFVPLVNIESDFSLIFGGLLLNGVALSLLLRYIADNTRAIPAGAARRPGLVSAGGAPQ